MSSPWLWPCYYELPVPRFHRHVCSERNINHWSLCWWGPRTVESGRERRTLWNIGLWSSSLSSPWTAFPLSNKDDKFLLFWISERVWNGFPSLPGKNTNRICLWNESANFIWWLSDLKYGLEQELCISQLRQWRLFL